MQDEKDRPSEADALPTPPVKNDSKALVTPGDDGVSETDAQPDAIEALDEERAEGAEDHDQRPDEPREAFSGRNDD